MKNRHVTVVSNHQVVPDCFTMTVTGSLEDFRPRSGQFIMVKLRDEYDPLLRRPFAASLTGASSGVQCEIIYKVAGRGTRIMSHMCPGTSLELLGPLGNGFSAPEAPGVVLVVAGGMGIVSLRALVLQLRKLPGARIHLFMGARSADRLLFYREFVDLGMELHLASEDGTIGYQGMVTEIFGSFLNELTPADRKSARCFACGPTPMLAAVARITSRHQLPCQVSLEARMACGIGACLGCVVKRNTVPSGGSGYEAYARVCAEGPVFDAGEIAW
jgi:dihydroorotate dehydrogenase electron transfer subunit